MSLKLRRVFDELGEHDLDADCQRLPAKGASGCGLSDHCHERRRAAMRKKARADRIRIHTSSRSPPGALGYVVAGLNDLEYTVDDLFGTVAPSPGS